MFLIRTHVLIICFVTATALLHDYVDPKDWNENSDLQADEPELIQEDVRDKTKVAAKKVMLALDTFQSS